MKQDRLGEKERKALWEYCTKLSEVLMQDAPKGMNKPSPLYRGGLIVPLYKGQGEEVVGPYTLRWEISGRHAHLDYRILFYRRHTNRAEVLIGTCRMENPRNDGWYLAEPSTFKHKMSAHLYNPSRFVHPRDYVQAYIDSGKWMPSQAEMAEDQPVTPPVRQEAAMVEPLWEYVS